MPTQKHDWTAGDEMTSASLNETGYMAFGEDGSDGALAISSGTTTIDLGAEHVVVKNYTSISITGSGKLAFSNPHANGTIIILKSEGDVTITASATCIDASKMGAVGGASIPMSITDGLPGSEGIGFLITCTEGLGGDDNHGVTAKAGGLAKVKVQMASNYSKYFNVAPGSGGGSGGNNSSSGTVDSGAGGRGGGTLIIECAGAWNFTTASGISVAGENGDAAVNTDSPQYATGGGSGGGGGTFIAIYDTLTANSGTVIVSGGGGGAAVSSGISSGLSSPYGSSGGGSVKTQGSTSLQGSDTSAPNGVSGGAGISITALNLDFV